MRATNLRFSSEDKAMKSNLFQCDARRFHGQFFNAELFVDWSTEWLEGDHATEVYTNADPCRDIAILSISVWKSREQTWPFQIELNFPK